MSSLDARLGAHHAPIGPDDGIQIADFGYRSQTSADYARIPSLRIQEQFGENAHGRYQLIERRSPRR